MHPALSVICFTTLSGAGYGLLFCWGLLFAVDAAPRSRPIALSVLGLGAVLVTAGLLASLAHLGQPQRAWRALSQWRSSWLSREGVAACLSFVPMLILGLALVIGAGDTMLRVSGAALALAALITVYCTARIYTSLPTVPAWQSPLVLPGFLLFALLGGSLIAGLGLSIDGGDAAALGLVAVLSALALGALKRRLWRDQVEQAGVNAAAAVGLPRERLVRSFEAPHTEANFITREMVFVLARRHAQRLRRLALILFCVIPAVLVLPVWLLPQLQAPWFGLGALSALIGSLVERWLFFAEARHVVSVYYRPESH